MAIKMIPKWYFGSEDNEEVKKYSKEISVLFKINGYNPKFGNFFDFFQLEDFEFIPCIQTGLHECDDYDAFEASVVNALEFAYDSTVEVKLNDLEKYSKNKNVPINVLLKDFVDGMKADSFIDFVNSCGSEIQSKFVAWIFNKS